MQGSEVMLSEEELKEVYNWVDEIPLSRTKKNIARDFSDAVMAAEVIAYYAPRMIELHNYSAVNSVEKKIYNWQTLTKRVLRRLRLNLKRKEIVNIVKCRTEAIEKFLLKLKDRLEAIEPNLSEMHKQSDNNQAYQISFNAEKQAGDIGKSRRATKPAPKKLKRPKRNFQVVDPDEARKDEVINELKETIEVSFEILEAKVQKMETLARLKDDKIDMMERRLRDSGVSVH